jgi:hypothetical protein
MIPPAFMVVNMRALKSGLRFPKKRLAEALLFHKYSLLFHKPSHLFHIRKTQQFPFCCSGVIY